MKATITLEYKDLRTATAVAVAVSPDNFRIPAGLKIKTERKNTTVATDMSLDGKIATLISTIDDLLENVSTAEKTLNIVKKEK